MDAETMELLTGVSNPFDQNTPVVNRHFKALRDSVLSLSVRLKELEEIVSRETQKKDKKKA